jgi:tetratricopeptide (TPR) repeat protein
MRQLLCVALVAAAFTPAAAAQATQGPATPMSASAVSQQDQRMALSHYKAGEQALHREAFDEAQREFEAAAKLDPFLELAPYGLGEVHMAKHEYAAAAHAYQKARELFHLNAANAQTNRVSAQQRIDDQIRALEEQRNAYQSGTSKSLPSPATMVRLNQQIDDLKFLRRRQSDGPVETPAWLSLALGSAYFRSDAMADAEREYRAAIQADPKLGEAHNNLAVVLMLTGRYADAEQEIKAAESNGYKVNPQLKADLKTKKGS